MIDSKVKEWATETQAKYIDSFNKHGTYGKVAKEFKVARQVVTRSIKAAKKKAALAGFSPDHGMTHAAPDGFGVKGVSTLYRDTGEIAAQWVKTDRDEQRQQEIMDTVVASMSETIKREKPVKPPKSVIEDLLNLYVITDYHYGALSWAEETGEDWDLDIAEDLIVKWFAHAIKVAPDSKVGLFADIGDAMHYDGLEALTPTSGNVLDADSRFQRVVRVVIRATRRIISLLLQKHEQVHVIQAEGNHNIASSVWMREFLANLYADEPRVTVDRTVDPYYHYEHGDTLLLFHHGHLRKMANVCEAFVGKYREAFGRTKFTYAHMGHFHSDKVIENNLMRIEQHRTLAAADAYSTRLGYSSGRDAKAITYSKQFGEVARLTISPDMVGSECT